MIRSGAGRERSGPVICPNMVLATELEMSDKKSDSEFERGVRSTSHLER